MTWNLNLKNTDECDTDNDGNVSVTGIRKIIESTGSTEKENNKCFQTELEDERINFIPLTELLGNKSIFRTIYGFQKHRSCAVLATYLAKLLTMMYS